MSSAGALWSASDPCALLYSEPCEIFTDVAANGGPFDPFEEDSYLKEVRTKMSQQEVTQARKQALETVQGCWSCEECGGELDCPDGLQG